MNKTKIKILNTAKALFNQHGFDQVTIRMIALELGMSSGNLNYHYKKREDILEALYFEMVETFDARLNAFPEMKVSFNQIKNDIIDSMERMSVYSFFWTDLYNLLNQNTEIKSHFQNVYAFRIEAYGLLFQKLIDQKLMQNKVGSIEYKYLSERMVNFSDTWLYSSKLYTNSIDSDYVELQANILLSMLYPYLTAKGKSELQLLIPGLI